MRLYYRGNTSSKKLPWQDECRPRFNLGKDEVECGNTASMTRGGPAVRMQQMGQYFQALLYIPLAMWLDFVLHVRGILLKVRGISAKIIY